MLIVIIKLNLIIAISTKFNVLGEKMFYSLEPSFVVSTELTRQLIKAGTDPVNQWFFTDGAFEASDILKSSADTWLNENYVVISENKILAYFEGKWNRPLDIISSFRLVFFDKSKSFVIIKAFFQYLDYLFVARGCNAFNWIVAEKNQHAYRIYEKLIKNYCGHFVGKRTCGQKSYTGIISDVYLYEITREEYFEYKKDTNE